MLGNHFCFSKEIKNKTSGVDRRIEKRLCMPSLFLFGSKCDYYFILLP